MTNDRHCQIATKVKAHVETTLPLVVPLEPQNTTLSLGDQLWASIYLESIPVPQCQWIVKMKKRLLSSSMFFGTSTSTLEDWDMGVSKNRGTPKWMVYDGKPY